MADVGDPVRLDWVEDSVEVVGSEVMDIVHCPVARAATDNSRGENAVSETASLGVFQVEYALLDGEEN